MIPLLPDLTDWENHEIYEIKPLLEYPVGLLQLAGYLAVFNYFDKDNHWGPGNKYNYMPPTRIELGLGAYALVNAPDAGVITYDVVDWPARALVTIGVIATADVWTGVLAATLTGVMGVL